MTSYCRECGREKRLDEWPDGFLKCPYCSGLTGFLRRLTGRWEKLAPLPENREATERFHEFMDGKLTVDEFERGVADAIGYDEAGGDAEPPADPEPDDPPRRLLDHTVTHADSS